MDIFLGTILHLDPEMRLRLLDDRINVQAARNPQRAIALCDDFLKTIIKEINADASLMAKGFFYAV